MVDNKSPRLNHKECDELQIAHYFFRVTPHRNSSPYRFHERFSPYQYGTAHKRLSQRIPLSRCDSDNVWIAPHLPIYKTVRQQLMWPYRIEPMQFGEFALLWVLQPPGDDSSYEVTGVFEPLFRKKINRCSASTARL